MTRVIHLTVLTILTTALLGCGQKGPLRRPEPESLTVAAVTAPVR